MVRSWPTFRFTRASLEVMQIQINFRFNDHVIVTVKALGFSLLYVPSGNVIVLQKKVYN